jgi:hypothetical protein
MLIVLFILLILIICNCIILIKTNKYGGQKQIKHMVKSASILHLGEAVLISATVPVTVPVTVPMSATVLMSATVCNRITYTISGEAVGLDFSYLSCLNYKPIKYFFFNIKYFF